MNDLRRWQLQILFRVVVIITALIFMAALLVHAA